MDIVFLAGYIIIIIIILVYIITSIYGCNNPDYIDEGQQSTVTYSKLGTRGDMGNQMFQLACTIAAGYRSDAKIVFPNNISNLPLTTLFNLEEFEWKDETIDATYYEYNNYETIRIPRDGRTYDIRGYRQAYKYFDDYAEQIRRIFTPKQCLLDMMKNVLPHEYIAVHIRRGDYIKSIHHIPLLREFRRCQLLYYQQAIKKLRYYYPDCPVIICTDSPDWVELMLLELDAKAMLAPSIPEINNKYSDFCILYLANGIVISNSTYSWWAAYLNKGRKVVAPSPWWDPDGFIARGFNLDKHYLQYPEWTILDTNTGKPVKLQLPDYTEDDTLSMYKLIRGMII